MPAQDSGNVIPFQGQLANQAGEPLLSAKAVTLVFRLYRAPVGNVAIWEESQPNISVNAGRFSVLLGSRTELPSYTNFNATLYLGITVDDGNPATTDVEMRPRQAFVPVVSARYAQNADKLNGFDWSAIFGVNNPSGKINGAKIAEGTITAANILSNTITAGQLAKSTITAAQLAGAIITSNQVVNGSISSSNLAPNSVLTTTIADSQITMNKLAPRQTLTNVVDVGGVAVSAVASAATSSFSFVDAPNLSVTISSVGRPVVVMLVSDAQSSGNLRTGVAGLANAVIAMTVAIVADGNRSVGLCDLQQQGSYTQAPNYLAVPASAVHFIDFGANAGSHTYQVRIKNNASSNVFTGEAHLDNVRLVAYEL